MGSINSDEEELNQTLLQANSESILILKDQLNEEDLKTRVWIETKKLWQIVGPSIFSRVASYSMNIVTQAFAGHLGDLELASISIANTVIVGFNFGLLLGMASALETLCGQAFGAKRYHMLGIYMQRSWIVLFLSCFLLLPLYACATPILKLLGQPDDVAEQSGLVAVWLIPLHFSFAFLFPIQRFLQSQLKAGVLAWVSLIVFGIHVVISWVFVYNLQLGIVGTAITLDVSWWLLFFGMFGYTMFGGCPDTWSGFSVEAFSGIWEFLKLSAASGVMLCLENWYYRILILMTGNLKNATIAVDALSVCMSVNGWEMMIPLAFFAATGLIMVFFKDFSSSGKHFLSIVDNKDDDEQTSSVLPVFRPSAGPFSPKWPKLESLPKLAEWSLADPSESPDHIFLQSPFHLEISRAKSFQTLGRRIISGDVRWGCKLRLGGEFGFIKNYWEWTEYILGNYSTVLEEACIYNAVYASLYTYDRNPDIIRAFCEAWCPTTNTLHTSAGELSISLWDLRLLGGLPIIGDIYEEMNPSALELTGVSERTNTKFVPHCCEFLFSAYHLLRKRQGGTSQVSINAWIRFWFRGATKHEFNKPRTRKSKSVTRPRSTHNPDGNLDESRKRTPAEEAVFDDLGISSAFRDKTYLASFLSCWLCVFVFPTSEENIIRPGTFKIASFLAEGHKYSLAMPVLASIYRGLNEISKSSHPERSCSYFPFHYVYGWLAFYFGTHYLIPDEARGPIPGLKMSKYSGEGGAKYFDEREARELIHVGHQAKWCELMINNSSETLVDNGNLCLSRLSYFLSLRSSYLILRQVNSIIVEPYSPNRFSRQFGFCQTLPGDLKKNVRSATPKQALEYWRICLAKSTFASISLPARCEDPNAHTTQSYLKWWSTVHSIYLIDGLEALIESTTSKSSSKSKRTKKRKPQESSDSEGFVDLEDDDNDDYEGGSTAKDGTEQPTSHPSSFRQTPEGTPSVQRSHPCHLFSVVEGEKVGDSQEHDAGPYIQSAPKKSKPSVLQRIVLHDTNLATFF